VFKFSTIKTSFNNNAAILSKPSLTLTKSMAFPIIPLEESVAKGGECERGDTRADTKPLLSLLCSFMNSKAFLIS
jgi:hypothetical protein